MMWGIGNGWLSHNPPNHIQPFIALLFLVKLFIFFFNYYYYYYYYYKYLVSI